VAYDGFEPSGRMHIAQGVLKALNVNKLTKSGVTFKFWCEMYQQRLCFS
jgi:tyrosyl-tRNA synthetase